MFHLNNNTVETKSEVVETPDEKPNNKYKNILNSIPSESDNDVLNYNAIDKLLENEKQKNKNEAWNKLDKTIKIQKLHVFAEKYGKENALPVKDIKLLKTFFIDCLEKNKLQKTKDVNYDKEKREIISVPALFFNNTNHNFTLKSTDAKRVSTLKSLTPKRVTANNNESIEKKI
jgi:hypothetical protein